MRAALALLALAACGDDDNAPQLADGEALSPYAAYAIIGGLDRVRIAKVASGGSGCVFIQAVHPELGADDVTLPASWSVERAGLAMPAGACNPAYAGSIVMEVAATGATGSIAWTGELPQTIDTIDVALTFESLAAESLVATGIPVQ